MLEGAMSVGGLGWRPVAHRRGCAERASRGEVNLGRCHGRGRAERAGREEADLGWRTGGVVGLGLGRRERPPVAWWHVGENEKRGSGVVLYVGSGLGFFFCFLIFYIMHLLFTGLKGAEAKVWAPTLNLVCAIEFFCA